MKKELKYASFFFSIMAGLLLKDYFIVGLVFTSIALGIPTFYWISIQLEFRSIKREIKAIKWDEHRIMTMHESKFISEEIRDQLLVEVDNRADVVYEKIQRFKNA